MCSEKKRAKKAIESIFNGNKLRQKPCYLIHYKTPSFLDQNYVITSIFFLLAKLISMKTCA